MSQCCLYVKLVILIITKFGGENFPEKAEMNVFLSNFPCLRLLKKRRGLWKRLLNNIAFFCNLRKTRASSIEGEDDGFLKKRRTSLPNTTRLFLFPSVNKFRLNALKTPGDNTPTGIPIQRKLSCPKETRSFAFIRNSKCIPVLYSIVSPLLVIAFATRIKLSWEQKKKFISYNAETFKENFSKRIFIQDKFASSTGKLLFCVKCKFMNSFCQKLQQI